ncbi:PilZ domain-containing protein [Erythrobacter sp. HL-111]|uniref:PilZ domain-containing protein n=1 Tax=Erythrobacter sp. HL-111 TaxID=1798193 RepID=UPI000B7E8FC1|nr:PilZ domain-containing protein [Erythrobacter sp. HL-111]
MNRSQEARGDRRAAPRGRLVLRIAKLVCETGEYPCILRDVSLTGAELAFWHEVPPAERVILQLSNGHTFPIERVWSGAGRAGYRFAVPVAEEDFIAGDAEFGHRPLRLSIDAGARVVDGRVMVSARLADLSAEGARIEIEGAQRSCARFDAGRLVSLAIAGGEPRLAEVRWAEEASVGLRFVEPMAMPDLAALALALQPFAAPGESDRTIRAA